MGFFSNLFGIEELPYKQTQSHLLQISQIKECPGAPYFREKCDFIFPDGRHVSAGVFSMPSVAELRDHVASTKKQKKNDAIVTVQNVVGEARSMHSRVVDLGERPVIIQAASQFNMLEMPSPSVTPEAGISAYANDRTQGPACATACAAGTAYRNYLVPVPFQPHQQRGQSRDQQLNGLEDLEHYLMEKVGLNLKPWRVKNGYVESSRVKLDPFNQQLGLKSDLREQLLSRIRIGVQENTTVTDLPSMDVQVTQTYNSALSIGYSMLPDRLWEPLARIVLDATYEATLLVGILQSRAGHASPIVYLTKVGGGVFRNRDEWIREAMYRAIEKTKNYGISLDIRIVHFGGVNQEYKKLELAFSQDKSQGRNEL